MMRIAQVSPLFERVPPERYGGTERVVSYLTEMLVEMGHDVTLYASGDSLTKARLESICPRALRLHADKRWCDSTAAHFLLLERLFKSIHEYDVVHFHVDYAAFPFLRRQALCHLHTLHGRLDLEYLPPIFEEYTEVPVVSISDAQRAPLSWLNWQGTVHHGIPAASLEYRPGPGRYLAFLGRVSPEKGLARAIAIAEEVAIPLKIAAKVDPGDREYFDTIVQPLLKRAKYAEHIGEIGDREKNDFLGNALALLFPIDWPEPFGMVQIEAMACGTPVLAFPGGSVREVIDDGVTGILATSIGEAVNAIDRIGQLDRRRVRGVFEKRFTSVRMAKDYLRIYRQLLDGRPSAPTYEVLDGGARGRDYPAEGSVLRTRNIGSR